MASETTEATPALRHIVDLRLFQTILFSSSMAKYAT